MKFESKYFEQYGDNAIVENIPEKHLTEMLVELTSLAIFNINPTIPGDETIKRAISLIIELVRTTYRNYPLLYVKRAFINGSLGVLGGTSVFSVRNINIWLASQREFVDAFYLREERDKRFRELAREEEEWRRIKNSRS